MSLEFILGDAAYLEAQRSLRALKKHHKDAEEPSPSPIYLTINVKIKLAREKDYRPRVVPITHKLDKVSNKAISLITKDPSTIYRDSLSAQNAPTEDSFNEIISLKKLKSMSRSTKSLVKLYKENDLLVADHRIHKFLPDILGTTFYLKKKKIPFMIQMARPRAAQQAELRKSKQSKLKDDRCDSKYVQAQLESIVGNTSYLPTLNAGDVISLKVGYTDWPVDKVATNIHDVISYLVDEKYRPVGGVLNLENLGNVHLRSGDSISLPVRLESDETADGEEASDDSDYDF
ncbi:uncharacterized protein LODBEIA_P24730 [Lodderomyces beijingensis]|uniref:Uncharacterized protein n=1 Tax=Lodderomyces beijingensis TaxID=1775926 RepID=A0ABP0ZJC6_9ASCO